MEKRGTVRRVFSSDFGRILFRNLPSSDVETAGGVSRNVEEIGVEVLPQSDMARL